MRNYSEAFQVRKGISYVAFVALALVLALPCSAWADDLTVDCTGSTPGAFGSIQAAVNALPAPPPGGRNSINIVSNCTENVTISGQHRLLLSGGWPPSPPATITAQVSGDRILSITGSQSVDIENLLLTGGSEGLFVGDGSSVTGVNLKAEGNWYSGITVDNNSSLFVWDGDAIGNGVWGIHAAGSSNVTLSGATEWVTGRPFVVSGNGADGIGADRAVVSILGGVTVEDNVESGIRLNPGTLAMGSYIPAENLIQHNPVGVVIMEGAQASFWGPNTIKENGVGVQAIIGSEVTFYEVVMPAGSVTLVEGNTSSGVEVSSNSAAWFFGHNKILNNGSTTDPLRAGIRVDGTSHALFEGGNEISGNTGPGIVADVNSSLDIWDTTISGNSEEGIRVRHMSIAEVQGSTATAGNGGGPLACDGSSLVISSLFAKTAKCANIEGAPSGPKPRTASMMRVAPNVRFMVQEARRAAERFKAPK